MYRMQVHDHRSTGMHWQIGKGGGFHYEVAEALGQPLPATVLLGGPPALILSAVAPLPENVPELMLASLIAGERLRQVRGAGAHPLVADAEFALIGEVPPRRPPARGPVRRPLRLLLAAARLPGVHGQADRAPGRRDLPGHGGRQAAAGGLLHRRPAAGAALAALPGRDAGGRDASGPTARPATTRWPPPSSSSATRARRWRARSGFSARASCRSRSSCSSPTATWTCSDFRATLEHVLARTRLETDLYVFSNLSMDTLDYSGPEVNKGSKGVWLGLGDPVRELPRAVLGRRGARSASPTSACSAAAAWSCGARRIGRSGRRGAPGWDPAFAGWPLVVLTDDAGARRPAANELPVDDVHAVRAGRRHPRRRAALVRNHVSYSRPGRDRRPDEALVPQGAVLRRTPPGW